MVDIIENPAVRAADDRARRDQARAIAGAAADIRIKRHPAIVELLDQVPLRDQKDLIVRAAMTGGGPAVVTVEMVLTDRRIDPVTLPRSDAMVRATHDLFDRRSLSDATMEIVLGINHISWSVRIMDGDEVDMAVKEITSLAVSNEEWSQVTVLRDAADSLTDPGYVGRTMQRAAAIIRESAKRLPDGYARHWLLVDAEVLEATAKQSPA